MSSPRNIHEMQQLNRLVATLNRFISKSADKCLSFFKILREKNFKWTNEFEMAFQHLKEYLESPSFFTIPTTSEELIIYLSVLPIIVNTVLIREEDKV